MEKLSNGDKSCTSDFLQQVVSSSVDLRLRATAAILLCRRREVGNFAANLVPRSQLVYGHIPFQLGSMLLAVVFAKIKF